MDRRWMWTFILAAIVVVILVVVLFVIAFVQWGPDSGLTLASANGEPLVVSSVDLTKYQGTWYEIAKIPQPFESQCRDNAKAMYELVRNPSGSSPQMRVVNSCGGVNQTYAVEGIAIPDVGTTVTPPSTVSPAKLSVKFNVGSSTMSGNLDSVKALSDGKYWILDLDPDYTHALVGSPDRSSLWILSRSKTLDVKIYDLLVIRASLLGYDALKLQKTVQN